MKKIYLYLMMALVTLPFAACSDNEDATPSHADYNKFAPADDDQSAEAKIRRDFKKQTNSYLIFNDTLSEERTGDDMYGNPVYKIETLDINFSQVGTSDFYIYTYEYIKDDAEKQKAANFVASKLAQKMGGMMPFSIMLADRIYCWQKDNNGNLVPAYNKWNNIVPNPTFVLGTRCLAISIENGEAFDDDNYFNSMLEDLVYKKLSAESSYMQDFYDVIENYQMVARSFKNELGYEFVIDDDLARSLGFAKDKSIYWFTYDKEQDAREFLKYLLTEPMSQIESEFAAYPICLKRFSLLRSKMIEKGYNFDD